MSARGLILDTFQRGIACLGSGYKHIYLDTIQSVVYEQLPDKYESGEIQVIPLPDGHFIIYTPKSARNAHLLEQQIKESNINPYLMGTLLEYNPEDIKFFYNRAKKIGTSERDYESDKKAAEQWLQKHNKNQ